MLIFQVRLRPRERKIRTDILNTEDIFWERSMSYFCVDTKLKQGLIMLRGVI